MTKRPIEADYTSHVAYTRALEAYCDSLEQPAKEPNGWRPIDTAPKDGTAVLVMRDIWPGTSSGHAENCNGHNTYVAAWWAGENAWVCYMDAVYDPQCPVEPTHWMPLPHPPSAPKAQQPAQVVLGVDWGSHGDRSCVSIIKKHADGVHEVVATEYGPIGSAPQAQPLGAQQPQVANSVCDKDSQGCWNVRCQLGKKCKNTAAPQAQTLGAQQPQLLTDDELEQMFGSLKAAQREMKFARVIEQAVLKKNGFEK